MTGIQETRNLVDQMPDPDRRGMLTENIDKDQIDKAIVGLFAGGRESLQQIVDMLDEPGSEADAKPHYALHCVLNQALVAGDEEKRHEFCMTLADNLDRNLSDYNKAFLCQELQWAGHDEAIPALAKLLQNEILVAPAVTALVSIGASAVHELRAALADSQGKCRLNILHGLVALEDRDSKNALMAALTDVDREVRLTAGAGLAKIAEPNSVAALLKAADVDAGWERIEATKHCLVLAENLLAAGHKDSARKVYESLKDSRRDPSEAYVQNLAADALADL